jgi:trimeric autotransporter adhesin
LSAARQETFHQKTLMASVAQWERQFMRKLTTAGLVLGPFLFATTFLVSPAQAQNIQHVHGSVISTNHSAIDATIVVPSQALITGATTVAATIGALASGAGAQASIDQTLSNTGNAGLDLSTIPFNLTTVSGSVSAKNTAKVNSTLTAPSASIGGGIANSVISQSTGASASASITSRFDSVATTGNAIGSTNKVKVDHHLLATNSGKITTQSNINGTASISDGVSNSIVAVGSGAVAVASITQSVSNSSGTGMDLKELPSNTVNVHNITARNTANVTSTSVITGDSVIGAGVGNTIGAQASGASAGADISSQFMNVTTSSTHNGAENKIKVANITSRNTGAVTSTLDIGSTGKTTVSITGGVDNSISASAVGASSLASTTQTASFSGATPGSTALAALPMNSTTIDGNITATNARGAPITASLTVAGNNNGTTSITGGVENSITAQAIGSLAGVSISQHINNVHN